MENRGTPNKTSSKKKWIIVSAIAVSILIAAVVGGVVGSRNSHNNSSDAALSTPSPSVAASAVPTLGNSSPKVNSTSSPPVPATAAPVNSTVTPINSTVTPVAPVSAFVNQPRWDWSKDKSIGICLGNWLILERWMNEDFWLDLGFDQGVYDEWNLTIALGAKAGDILDQHYSSWIVESDIQTMFESGINMLRIPMGFWMWIPTVAGEPYIQGNQIANLNRILGYVAARGMYVNLDLHALPGSQNGEESSGRNSTSPSWFGNSANQARSDTLVKTVSDFVAASPYRACIASIEIINEPRAYTDEQNQELISYYTRSYTTISNSNYPIPLLFTHGSFGTYPFMDTFRDFATAHATVPPSAIFVQHPYPGSFPLQTNQANMLSQVCSALNEYVNFPVPICISEWSVYTGVTTASFESQFYSAQLASWSNIAGSMFWSYKLLPSQKELNAGLNYYGWSFINLLSQNSVPINGNTVTTAGQGTYLSGLSGGCPIPSGIAPNPTASQVWAGLAKQNAAIAAQK